MAGRGSELLSNMIRSRLFEKLHPTREGFRRQIQEDAEEDIV
jgi:uncharacterized membrane protein YqiK